LGSGDDVKACEYCLICGGTNWEHTLLLH